MPVPLWADPARKVRVEIVKSQQAATRQLPVPCRKPCPKGKPLIIENSSPWSVTVFIEIIGSGIRKLIYGLRPGATCEIGVAYGEKPLVEARSWGGSLSVQGARQTEQALGWSEPDDR